jgi:hypothetical protein
MLEQLIQTISTNNVPEAKSLVQQIDKGELNKTDHHGKTALMWAAEKGMKEVCELLIPKMSLQSLMSKSGGQTAADLATNKGHNDIAALIDTATKELSVTEKPYSKELNTYMTKTDIKNFSEAQAQSKLEEHIAEYIKLHSKDGVSSKEDFYSLLLNAAISLEDVNQVANILDKIKELKIVSVLTSADDSHHNPISVALYSDNMKVIELIDSFIELQKTKLSPSSTMSEQVAKNMRLALEATPEGMSIDYCLDHFLVPLYEQNVIDMLLGCSEESD